MRNRTIDNAAPDFTLDASLVAERLGIAEDALRRAFAAGEVWQICERGEGEDAGRWRIRIRHRAREAIILVNDAGQPVG